MENISPDVIVGTIKALTWVIPVLFSVIPHEIAHGYVAYLMGDNTAKEAGRLSINPIKHIDIYGTIILPLFLMWANIGIVFGYAKPVPVNFRKIANIRKGLIFVALAGPVTNFILAFIFVGLMYFMKFFGDKESFFHMFLYASFANAVLLNFGLGIFNLLPLPPLDGGKIMMGVLPTEMAIKYAKLDGRIGFFILFLLLMLPNILGEKFDVIGMFISGFMKIILSLPFLANL